MLFASSVDLTQNVLNFEAKLSGLIWIGLATTAKR